MTNGTSTSSDDDLIVPLLQRMPNLESLALYLRIAYIRKKKFLDGNDLKKNILDYLPYLNKFMFSIYSSILHQSCCPSNEDIQKTFENFRDIQVISRVDYYGNKEYGECHIYSYPCTMKYYENIKNNFPGGLFKSVREISLIDQRPFEKEFFLRISQSFPFLKILVLKNKQAQQQHKQSQRSINENNQHNSIITYPHLIKLDLYNAHDDYVELFLDHTRISLFNKIRLCVNYQLLERVTHQFTRETTRFNCAQVTRLDIYTRFKMTDHFRTYFPHVDLRAIPNYY